MERLTPSTKLEYKLIPDTRFKDVIQYLRETFFADEPLNKAANLCKKGEGHLELEELSLTTLENNLSIMAISKNNQIAGVVINGMLFPGDVENSEKKISMSTDQNFRKIFNLIYSQNLEFNLFEKYGVEKVFDIRILSVHPNFRGLGIAKELVNRSVQLAECYGFRLLKADATGMFSQKIIKSCGFSPISELYYAKYTDEHGIPILPVEAPHIKLELLIKQLD